MEPHLPRRRRKNPRVVLDDSGRNTGVIPQAIRKTGEPASARKVESAADDTDPQLPAVSLPVPADQLDPEAFDATGQPLTRAAKRLLAEMQAAADSGGVPSLSDTAAQAAVLPTVSADTVAEPSPRTEDELLSASSAAPRRNAVVSADSSAENPDDPSEPPAGAGVSATPSADAFDTTLGTSRPIQAVSPGETTGVLPKQSRKKTTLVARPEEESEKWGRGKKVRSTVFMVMAGVLLAILSNSFLFSPYFIPTDSMAPALASGDRILASKLTPKYFSLERGDVVVFHDPGDWVPENEKKSANVLVRGLQKIGLEPENQQYVVKRIIGLPGDKVACCNNEGQVTVNGVALNEPYLHPGDSPSLQHFSVQVPAGHLWVMGDHRAKSLDSRAHDDGTGNKGSIPISAVVGKAKLTFWPVTRLGFVDSARDVFAQVPAPTQGPRTQVPQPTTKSATPSN